MCKATLACLVLLLCFGQSGCDQKPSLNASKECDAAGYLVQPEQDFLVRGESRVWRQLFIQFDVNGHETKPFILNIEHTTEPHDAWPLAPENKTDKQTGSGFSFSSTEDPPRPFGLFFLNSEEVASLAEGVRKYFKWSDTAVNENLNVTGKELVSVTNQRVNNITDNQGKILIGSTNRQLLQATFSRPKESSNSFIAVLITPTEPWASSGSLSSSCSITLDKMGAERLLSVITNLPSRREKFIRFRDDQEKIARQRRETQQNEKARADELLH